MIKLAISYNNHVPANEFFPFIKTLGFDGIDYVSNIKDLWLPSKGIINQSKENKISILSIHQPLYTIIMTPKFLFPRVFKMLDYFQVSTFNLHLSSIYNLLQNGNEAIDNFLFMAKNRKVLINFESNPAIFPCNTYPKPTYDPESFGEFCKKNNLSITLDTSHVGKSNYDIVKFFVRYKNNIKTIHLSDYDGQTDHLPLGQGKLPIRKLLEEVKKTKNSYLIVLEIHRAFKNHEQKEAFEKIRESFNFAKDCIE